MLVSDDSAALLPDQSANWRSRAIGGLVLGLLWLTIAAAVLAIGVQAELVRGRLDSRSLLMLVASLIVQIAPPIAIVALAAATLRRSGPGATAHIAALEARQARATVASDSLRAGVDAIDRALAGIGDRLSMLQAAVSADEHGLTHTAQRLETATGAMAGAAQAASGAATRLQNLIEGGQQQAEAISVLLDANGAETVRQLEAVETMLAAVWSRNADAVTQVYETTTGLQALLASIDQAATQAVISVGDHAAALHRTADAAFDRTAAALDASRDGVDAQAALLLASVDHARTTLDDIGGEAARVIGKRLDRLNEAAEQLGQRLLDQDTRSRTLVDTVERSFTVLDARLDHAARNSHAALDGIAQRMTGVGTQVQQLNLPLRETQQVMLDTEAAVGRLQASAAAAIDTIAQALPAHQATAVDLGDALQKLHEATLQLAEPVEYGRLAIAAAADDLAAHRTQLDAGAGQLTAQFEAARAVLGDVEAQAEGSALAAASQLIEVLGRVREIAAASAGQMRDTLAGVVDEAQAALAHAGSTTAETAFGAPVREQLSALEAASRRAADAAQEAAGRVAQRLLGLTGAVAAVEARVDEVQTHFDVQARDDLRARSTRLIESLNAASIDIARLLMLDVGDASWNAYLKGDRGIFTRRVVQLADATTSRAIRRHYAHDLPFRELTVQFIDEFKRLLKYVDADKDGRALAVTLLSSDIGKLYVILEQGAGKAA